MVLLISYSLVTPGQQYTKLDQRITAYSGRRILEWQWIIVGPYTADGLWQDLVQTVDANDKLLVTELTRNATWAPGKLLIRDSEMRSLIASARC